MAAAFSLTPPGYNRFSAFCTTAEIDYKKEQVEPLICNEVGIVSDDEEDDVIPEAPFIRRVVDKVKKYTGIKRPRVEDEVTVLEGEMPVSEGVGPRATDFDLDGKEGDKLPTVIEDEELRQQTNATAELLRYHHQYGHCSFRKLQIMANQGVIPTRLANCQLPICSVIGKLNYLEKATRSDIAYITHQCARFVDAPKIEHGKAVRWLARYLKGTRDKGTILKPIQGKELEVFVDADFAGNWDQKEWRDPDTARSRHGFIITYAGAPLLWKSQLQTEHALSSTESEYTGLSYALRDAIPIMELLKEMIQMGYPIQSSNAKVHCKVFEDNSGALEIAKNPKFRPRTKHLNNRLHHFRHYVDDLKEISIHKIETENQPSDYLTKPLNETLHCKHRKFVMGW